MIMGHDGSTYHQYVFWKKNWKMPAGQSKLVPKELERCKCVWSINDVNLVLGAWFLKQCFRKSTPREKESTTNPKRMHERFSAAWKRKNSLTIQHKGFFEPEPIKKVFGLPPMPNCSRRMLQMCCKRWLPVFVPRVIWSKENARRCAE